MKIQLETGEQNLISHYGPGSISVNGNAYSNNILITAQEVFEDWFSGDLDSLKAEHFAPLISDSLKGERPEIVLLGTGAEHRFPNMALLAELQRFNLTVEVMNTRAACRTYSVLAGEDRPVAAALLQIDAG